MLTLFLGARNLVRNKSKIEQIAVERIEKLLNFATLVYNEKPKLAHRYAELAWNIKTRYNLELASELKNKLCRKCQSFWLPGETCRVRLRSSRSPRIVITCLNCGYKKRIPY